MNISLPVYLSDYRSMLQVFAYELRNAPLYLDRIYNSTDTFEKLKWATVFFISQFYLSPLASKPFNPILGETFQCKTGNMNIYLEQTVHKPPTGNFYCYDDNKTYKFYGYIESSAKTGANSAKAKKAGKVCLEFKDGSKYKFYYPTVRLDGTLMGKTYFNYKNVCLVVDEVNEFVSYVKINPAGDKGMFKKLLSKTNDFPDAIKGDIIALKDLVWDPKKKNKHTQAKNATSISGISGYWSEKILFDDVIYWERERYSPLTIYEPEFKLPSDSTFRTDMIAWIQNKLEEAQAEKEKLEEIQRNDTKLRNANSNTKNKKEEKTTLAPGIKEE